MLAPPCVAGLRVCCEHAVDQHGKRRCESGAALGKAGDYGEISAATRAGSGRCSVAAGCRVPAAAPTGEAVPCPGAARRSRTAYRVCRTGRRLSNGSASVPGLLVDVPERRLGGSPASRLAVGRGWDWWPRGDAVATRRTWPNGAAWQARRTTKPMRHWGQRMSSPVDLPKYSAPARHSLDPEPTDLHQESGPSTSSPIRASAGCACSAGSLFVPDANSG